MIVALVFLVLAFVASLCAAVLVERGPRRLVLKMHKGFIYAPYVPRYSEEIIDGNAAAERRARPDYELRTYPVERDGARVANGHLRVNVLRDAGVQEIPTLDVHVARALRDTGMTLAEFEALPEDQRRGLRAAAKVRNFGEAFGAAGPWRHPDEPQVSLKVHDSMTHGAAQRLRASPRDQAGPSVADYAVHRMIEEDIVSKSLGVRPSRVTYPPGHWVPDGSYELDRFGVWVRVGAHDDFVPLHIKPVDPGASS